MIIRSMSEGPPAPALTPCYCFRINVVASHGSVLQMQKVKIRRSLHGALRRPERMKIVA